MDILNNVKYYKGFEGEPEIIFQFKDNKDISIHIWEGYIDDIMRNQPGTDEDYKKGLSYDWNTMEGPYDDNGNKIINVKDYYKDLLRFKETKFEYKETKKVYELIIYLLEKALEEDKKVELIVD